MSEKVEPVRPPYEYGTTNWRGEETEYDFYIHGACSEDLDEDEDSDGSSEEQYTRSCVAVAIVHGNPTGRDVAEATAAFLCRAANCHAELLAALENLLGAIGDPYRGQDRSMRLLTIVSGRPEYQAIDAAHAALAKATGAQS